MKCRQNASGYTLVELMMVVVIIGLITSIMQPHVDLLLKKAYQAKSKNNLGFLRTAINLYFTENEGTYPLPNASPGDTHYTANGFSLHDILVPTYMTNMQPMLLKDSNPTYNGLTVSYDYSSQVFMEMNPPKMAFIVLGPPAYTPLLNSMFAYDNTEGYFYVSNGNLDTAGNYFYDW